MKIEYFHVNAFTGQVFHGNPAGVCLLETTLDDSTMQRIAFENAVSETAFVSSGQGFYYIRWFSPQTEVDLCGHATLAAAHVMLAHKGVHQHKLEFHSRID